MSTGRPTQENVGFFAIAFSREVLPRAMRVALIVGTILAFINHGDKMMFNALSTLDIGKVILTYFVPYSVSTWSSVRALQERIESVAFENQRE